MHGLPVPLDLSPADTVLGFDDLRQRYRSGRHKTHELIADTGLVRSLLPGSTWVGTLEGLYRWELHQQLAGTLAALPPPPTGGAGRGPRRPQDG